LNTRITKAQAMSDDKLPRTVLPIPDGDRGGLTTYDTRTRIRSNLDHLITPEDRLHLAMARQ
jgi:hypothetical protein